MSSKGQKNFFTARKGGNRALVIPAILAICSVGVALAGGVSATPAAAVPASPQAKKWADQMPDGDGKKLIVARCQLCHTLERVVTSHRTKDDWQAVIALMIEQGANLTDDESKTVVDYLAMNYPPAGAAGAGGAAGASTSGGGAAVAGPAGASTTMIVDADQTSFTATPDALGFPKGVMMATVSGDPAQAGLFSILLKLTPDQTIPGHSFSSNVDLVVLKGTYQLGNGDIFDAGKLQAVTTGQVVHIPAQSHHFGQAKGPAVVLLYGVGPLSVTWNK